MDMVRNLLMSPYKKKLLSKISSTAHWKSGPRGTEWPWMWTVNDNCLDMCGKFVSSRLNNSMLIYMFKTSTDDFHKKLQHGNDTITCPRHAKYFHNNYLEQNARQKVYLSQTIFLSGNSPIFPSMTIKQYYWNYYWK